MKWTWAIAFFLMVFGYTAYSQTLNWEAPTERVDGTAIDDPNSMFYTLYYNTGSGRFRVSTTVNETFIDISRIPTGCYNLRVTATFHDDKATQSAPSNEVYYCVDDYGETNAENSPPKQPVIGIVE